MFAWFLRGPAHSGNVLTWPNNSPEDNSLSFSPGKEVSSFFECGKEVGCLQYNRKTCLTHCSRSLFVWEIGEGKRLFTILSCETSPYLKPVLFLFFFIDCSRLLLYLLLSLSLKSKVSLSWLPPLQLPSSHGKTLLGRRKTKASYPRGDCRRRTLVHANGPSMA